MSFKHLDEKNQERTLMSIIIVLATMSGVHLNAMKVGCLLFLRISSASLKKSQTKINAKETKLMPAALCLLAAAWNSYHQMAALLVIAWAYTLVHYIHLEFSKQWMPFFLHLLSFLMRRSRIVEVKVHYMSIHLIQKVMDAYFPTQSKNHQTKS